MGLRGVNPLSRDRYQTAPGLLGYTALGALVALLYGRHLSVGYLSDDFLFLEWAGQGLGELMRRVTGGAEPRFLRPLPALLWYLGPSVAGSIVHHAISLGVHAMCGMLVARIAARRCGSRESGLIVGALFLAFPLFTEPVIWLAAGPDLWACCFALAALDLGLRTRASTTAVAGAAMLFAAGLLSKESVFMLPLLPLFLAPWRKSRRLCLAFSLVAGAYLCLRLVLIGGPGGYVDAEGQSRVFSFDPLLFIRNVCLQLPYRLLVPLKRAGDLLLPLAGLSTFLALAFASAAKLWQRPSALLTALAAGVVALLPVAPLFSIDVDQERSRVLYFPVAVLALAAASCLPAPIRGTRLRLAAAVVLTYWGTATVVNGRVWSEAGREIEQTLALMRGVEDRYDPGTTVLVAGHDTWKGAYVWRNGLAFASRLHGLRRDIHWILGTAAARPDTRGLGLNLFAIGFDASGHAVDWTACERSLRESGGPVLASFQWPPNDGEVTPARVPGRLDSPSLRLTRETRTPAVRLRFADCPAMQRPGEARQHPMSTMTGTTGRLYWRQGGPGNRLTRRFNVTDARTFKLLAGTDGEVVIRLAATQRALGDLEFRIETARPAWLGCLREVSVLEGPPSCAGEVVPD